MSATYSLREMLPLLLVLFCAIAIGLSLLLSFVFRKAAIFAGIIDQPTGGRKIHSHPIPLLGGWGIGIAIILLILLASSWGVVFVGHLVGIQLFGFVIGIIILLVGGFLDDRFHLPPVVQVLFPILAALAVILTKTTIAQITNPSGGAFSLFVWHITLFRAFGESWVLSFPSDVLTFVWLISVTYAMKFLDGLDGLVSGQAVIGAGLIAALTLTHAYFQPDIAFLAVIIGGAFLGFLPFNFFPAKHFLGESGSTIAGFSLAFLAIVSGTKVATAFMAIGLPLADASFVILGRLLRGVSPFHGDDTHLHFKLLKAGLSQRAVVFLFWSISLLFGIAALGVQTKGKILLILALLGVTCLLSYVTALRLQTKAKRV